MAQGDVGNPAQCLEKTYESSRHISVSISSFQDVSKRSLATQELKRSQQDQILELPPPDLEVIEEFNDNVSKIEEYKTNLLKPL